VGALNDIIMVYPSTREWENFRSDNDPDNFMKNTGIMPTAFKNMIARLTSTIAEADEEDGEDQEEEAEVEDGEAEEEDEAEVEDEEDVTVDEALAWLEA